MLGGSARGGPPFHSKIAQLAPPPLGKAAAQGNRSRAQPGQNRCWHASAGGGLGRWFPGGCGPPGRLAQTPAIGSGRATHARPSTLNSPRWLLWSADGAAKGRAARGHGEHWPELAKVDEPPQSSTATARSCAQLSSLCACLETSGWDCPLVGSTAASKGRWPIGGNPNGAEEGPQGRAAGQARKSRDGHRDRRTRSTPKSHQNGARGPQH
jgi:hypothetical protein